MRRALLLGMVVALAGGVAAGVPGRAAEEADGGGWISLFDGKTLNGWKTSNSQPSKRPVEDGAINPHRAGAYMVIHEKQWADFILSLDFKLSKGCNSGVFFRTFPLSPYPGRDVGWNGLEIALDDTTTAGYHDTGALYDLVKPTRNAMKPVGEWNHLVLVAVGPKVEVSVNGEKVMQTDLSQFREPNKRPDGSMHKFDFAVAKHPRKGYIGLQDHGSDCWYKNIRIKPL